MYSENVLNAVTAASAFFSRIRSQQARLAALRHLPCIGQIDLPRHFESMSRTQRAVELFSLNCNCAQSVFAACGASKGLSEAQRLAVAAPFGGGIARQGEICGALTGALMALGEAGGDAMAADPDFVRNDLYKRAQQLTETFRSAHGSIYCRELTGCALNTEAGQRVFKERGVHKNVCCRLVASAVELLDEILPFASSRK
jgi:C_GCAxxG_C_C family probable redox protein